MRRIWAFISRVTEEKDDNTTKTYRGKMFLAMVLLFLPIQIIQFVLRYRESPSEFFASRNFGSFYFFVVVTIVVPVLLKFVGSRTSITIFLASLYGMTVADVHLRHELSPQLATFFFCSAFVNIFVRNQAAAGCHFLLIFAGVVASMVIYAKDQFGSKMSFTISYDKFIWEHLAVVGRVPLIFAVSFVEEAMRAERMRHLVKLNEEIARLSAAKDTFFAAVSHELRNPLNALLGILEIISTTPGLNAKLLKTGKYCGEILLNLIGNVLDVSKIEAGKMLLQPQSHSLKEQMHSVWEMYKPLFKEKGLYFRLLVNGDLPPTLLYDRQRMNQVLINIIGNGVKFASHGGVTISVAWYPLLLEADRESTFQRLLTSSNRYDLQDFIEEGDEEDHLMTEQAVKHILRPRSNMLACIGSYTERKRAPSISLHLENNDEIRSGLCARPIHRMEGVLDANQSPRLVAENKDCQTPPKASKVRTCRKTSYQFIEEEKTQKDTLSLLNMTESTEGFVKIEIVDTGIGITSEAQARLFQPFVQANAGISSRFGGTGLGLYITKIIIKQLMGGDIRIDSEPGAGSNFIIVVPMKVAAPEQVLAPCTATQQQLALRFPGKRVLLVEDQDYNITMMKNLLSTHALEVDVATDGLEGYHKYTNAPDHYDVVITDLRMPRMTGQDMVVAIRRDEKQRQLRPVPFLVVTGEPTEDERSRCLEVLQVIDYFKKPINTCELLATLDRLFNPQSKSVPLPQDENRPNDDPTILLVEDDAFCSGVVKKMLETQGHRVQQAFTRESAVATYLKDHEHIRIVLLDSNLPDGSGPEVLQDMRAIEKRLHIRPVKVISVSGNDPSLQEMEYAGLEVRKFLLKPVTQKDLLSALLS